MRITIIKSIEGYQNVFLDVQDWFCKSENIIRRTASIIRQTDKAILLDFGDNRMCWIPKRLVTVHPLPKGLGEWQSITEA